MATSSGSSRRPPSRGAVSDGAALLLLAISLTLPWNLVQVGGQRVEVVAALAVSAASLALPRAHARGLLPPAWTTHRVRSARSLAALPYLVCAGVTVVVDAVRGFADPDGHAGIGGSMALGLAGVLLAALPAAEQGEAAGPGDVQGRRRSAGALGAVLALLVAAVVVSMASALSQEVPFGSLSADARVVLDAACVLVLAVPAMALVAGARGRAAPRRAGSAWRASAVAVGVASASAYVVGGWTPLGVLAPIESLHLQGFGLVLLAPLAAAAVGTRAIAGEPTIAAAACAAAVAAGLWAVIALMRTDALAAGDRSLATAVLAALAVAGFVLAVTVRSRLRRHLTRHEHPDPLAGASGLAVAAVALSVVDLLVVAGDTGTVVTQVDVFSLALPVAVVGLLLMPAAARARVAAARAARHGPPPRQPPAPSRPVPGQPLPGPSSRQPSGSSVSFLPPPGFTPGQAADPSTSPALLTAMVEVAPHLRPAVAANPAASGELIARLRSFGDPDVDAVLRARGLV